jgi:hypothetical protein
MAIKATNIGHDRGYDDAVFPAIIANTILDEFKGFNPFNLLKYINNNNNNNNWYYSPILLFFQLNAMV